MADLTRSMSTLLATSRSGRISATNEVTLEVFWPNGRSAAARPSKPNRGNAESGVLSGPIHHRFISAELEAVRPIDFGDWGSREFHGFDGDRLTAVLSYCSVGS